MGGGRSASAAGGGCLWRSPVVVRLSGVPALESGMGAYAVSVGAVSLTLTSASAVACEHAYNSTDLSLPRHTTHT